MQICQLDYLRSQPNACLLVRASAQYFAVAGAVPSICTVAFGNHITTTCFGPHQFAKRLLHHGVSRVALVTLKSTRFYLL